MNPRTEKAIKAWLKLPPIERGGYVDPATGAIGLHHHHQVVATFTLRSIIAKRVPKRKKAKAKYEVTGVARPLEIKITQQKTRKEKK